MPKIYLLSLNNHIPVMLDNVECVAPFIAELLAKEMAIEVPVFKSMRVLWNEDGSAEILADTLGIESAGLPPFVDIRIGFIMPYEVHKTVPEPVTMRDYMNQVQGAKMEWPNEHVYNNKSVN